MKRFLNILGKAVKALVIVAIGSAIRIARGQGEGVFEQAIQTAVAEAAETYLRSVKTA